MTFFSNPTLFKSKIGARFFSRNEKKLSNQFVENVVDQKKSFSSWLKSNSESQNIIAQVNKEEKTNKATNQPELASSNSKIEELLDNFIKEV